MITTCQVCGRTIKAKLGVIAHHGYTRPYWDHRQTASCAGARYVPYEQSCDRLKEVIGWVEELVVTREEALHELVSSPPEEIVVYDFPSRYVYSRPVDFVAGYYSSWGTYEGEWYMRKDRYESEIKLAKIDLDRMCKRLAEWKPAHE